MSGAMSAHFSEAELACHHGVNGCTQLLVDTLEEFRAKVGNKPVTVADAFRCSRCNSALRNSATHSQHMLGLAADVSVAGMTAAQLEAVARTIPAIHGIGRNDHKNFLHLDVRETHAAWCYNADDKVELYYAPGTMPETAA